MAVLSLLRDRTSLSITLAALATLTAAYIATAYVRFRNKVKNGFKFPELQPPTFPLGHVMLLRDYLKCLGDLHEIKDPATGIASLWLGKMQALVIHKADHVNKVLNSCNYREPIPALAHHFEVILGEHSVTALMHNEWRVVRSLMSKPFQFSQLCGMANTMIRVAEDLAQYMHSLPTGQEVDVHPLFKLGTLDVIGLTAFGHDFGCVANAARGPSAEVVAFEFLLSEYSRRLGENPITSAYWLPTAANRAHHAASRLLRGRIDGLVRERRALMAAGQAGDKDDFLGHMLSAAGPDGNGMSDSVLSDQLMTLMFGGYDTTSIALSFSIYLLATHPEIQAELHAEVDGLLHGRLPTYDDYNNLKYTTQIVKETLRLYPPAPLTTRTLEEPLEIEPGLVLPSGTLIWLPLTTIQRSSLNWSDPLSFRPERFASGAVVPPGAWVPFSAGSRNCIGMKFALLEATLFLAILSQHFSFTTTLPKGTLPAVMWGIVQKPVGGVPVTLHSRK